MLVGACVAIVLLHTGCVEKVTGGTGPVLEIRAENLPVTPSTGPVAYVQVRNTGGRAFDGALAVQPPEGWVLNRAEQHITVAPGRATRVAFAIEKGADSPDNRYAFSMSAVGGGVTTRREQTVVAASAPFFKPVIDGKRDDWAEAIPVTFTAGGRKTTISTYWNSRDFCLLVAVEEDKLVRLGGAGAGECDAIQFAIAPREAATPKSQTARLQRFEFLVVPVGGDGARCCMLARIGDLAGQATKRRTLAETRFDEAQTVVTREGGVTYYEVAVPLAAMPDIRPEPGREFCFSLLVHDPDGTGLRDWGDAAGLSDGQRSRLAWSDWEGAKWPAQPPKDGMVEWGFCSSKR
jgi:hypothetical protein